MKINKTFAALALFGAVVLPGLADAQDTLRGQALAERWCSSCHVVTRAPTTAQSNGLPTFPALAARSDMTAEKLKVVMTGKHIRMPDFQLGSRDQNDLAAYIFSLRPN